MIKGPFEFNHAGKKKVQSRNLVLCWIKKSWREIPEEMVRKSFLTSSISNALDSTEDNAIYEEEPDIHTEENEMDEEFDTESEDEPYADILDKKKKTKQLLQEPPHIKS